MSAHQIYTQRCLAAPATQRPPLLFIHGAYVNSECWLPHFLPYFQQRGYDCIALDLAGHGRSEGREQLDSFGIDDYATDVAGVAATLAQPPVLIAHSMGAVVAQRYLERHAAAGVALLAPVPTTGLSFSSMQVAAKQPEFLREASRAVRRKYSEHTVRVMREVYFSPDASDDDLTPFLPLVQQESNAAIAEMMAMAWMVPKRRPRLPALVMGGGSDAVFAANMLHFTAASWRAETAVIPRAGHMLMMDPQWPAAAERLAQWLATVPDA